MENTIGFYDSGVGGLHILQKTISHLGNLILFMLLII